jgi:hypothetical protein
MPFPAKLFWAYFVEVKVLPERHTLKEKKQIHLLESF